MSRRHSQVTFKPYVMNQPSLFPANQEKLIPEDHLVRVVNRAIDQLHLAALLSQYNGGGTLSYHPKLMLKVLVYAYTQRIYPSRQIAKALRENVHFMRLSGGNQPDSRTLNQFRSKTLKAGIDPVFAAVLEYLID